MAIVGFAVAFSVAKVYSVKHDYIIDGNQVSCRDTSRVDLGGLLKKPDCFDGLCLLVCFVIGTDSLWGQ